MNNGIPVGEFLSSFSMDWVFGGLKLLYLVAFLLYAAFALVVVVQIKQMVASLQSGFETTLVFLGWVHLLVALGALGLAFMIL